MRSVLLGKGGGETGSHLGATPRGCHQTWDLWSHDFIRTLTVGTIPLLFHLFHKKHGRGAYQDSQSKRWLSGAHPIHLSLGRGKCSWCLFSASVSLITPKDFKLLKHRACLIFSCVSLTALRQSWDRYSALNLTQGLHLHHE